MEIAKKITHKNKNVGLMLTSFIVCILSFCVVLIGAINDGSLFYYFTVLLNTVNGFGALILGMSVLSENKGWS